ncbi:MAG: hypothetical protein JWN14_719, partial [Chthonomonadales bacterium]|nr:hypothetical protein [Chthonomonadales bacterium]
AAELMRPAAVNKPESTIGPISA